MAKLFFFMLFPIERMPEDGLWPPCPRVMEPTPPVPLSL